MKKYLPVVLFVVGIVVLVGVIFIVKGNKQQIVPEEDTEVTTEVPAEQRPFTSLTPSADGHWLKLRIEAIGVRDAVTLDYELAYDVPNAPSQGVPGTVAITPGAVIERDLLLGSESSGKFRYDVGVTKGVLTLRFRNGKGKLVGRLTTDFHLQSNTKELTSIGGKYTYTLPKITKGVYYVTMGTFGTSSGSSAIATDGTYAVFASSK